MPPDLFATYFADLNIAPIGSKELIGNFHFFTREGGLFRACEHLVTNGDYHFYLDVYSVGCTEDDFFTTQGEDMMDDGVHQDDIVRTLLSFEMEDEIKTKRVGRIGYSDFNFTEIDGHIATGKQIKSAEIDQDYRGAGLASNIYRMLVNKYEHVICDNMQSIAGGSLWASSIITVGEVRVYDSRRCKFIDVLGRGGKGVEGSIPWGCHNLTASEIEQWDRPYSTDPRHHIVNIISRENLFDT